MQINIFNNSNKKNSKAKKKKINKYLENEQYRHERIKNIYKKYGTGKYKAEATKKKEKIKEAAITLENNKKIKQNYKNKKIKNTPLMRLYVVYIFLLFTIIIFSYYKHEYKQIQIEKNNQKLKIKEEQ